MSLQLIELTKIEISLNTELAFNALELQDSLPYAPDEYLSAGYRLGMMQQDESTPRALRDEINNLSQTIARSTFFKSGFNGSFYRPDQD